MEESEKLTAIKFKKEYDQKVIQFLQVGREKKLDYLSLNDLLKDLGFLTKGNAENVNTNNSTFSKERGLFYDLWWILRGEKYQGVHRKNLYYFLLAVLRITFKVEKNKDEFGLSARALQKDFELGGTKFKPEDKKKEKKDLKIEISLTSSSLQPEKDFLEKSKCYRQEAAIKKLKIGKFDNDGEWDVSERDIEKIAKMFELLYRNKLKNESIKKTNYKIEIKTKPVILETSKVLAGNRKERLIQGTNFFFQNNSEMRAPNKTKITHHELLYIQDKAIRMKKERVKEDQEKFEVQQCSFKPVITPYNMGKNVVHAENQSQANFLKINQAIG